MSDEIPTCDDYVAADVTLSNLGYLTKIAINDVSRKDAPVYRAAIKQLERIKRLGERAAQVIATAYSPADPSRLKRPASMETPRLQPRPDRKPSQSGRLA